MNKDAIERKKYDFHLMVLSVNLPHNEFPLMNSLGSTERGSNECPSTGDCQV
jgi:hypothetical protein